MSEEDKLKKFIKQLKDYWGDRLPDPNQYPKTFEYYVKIFQYYKHLENNKTK